MQFTEVISPEEFRALRERSNLAGLRVLALTWGSIAAVFALPALWPNPLTLLLAIIMLGGRQLALAAIMHECGHRTLFDDARLNRFVGRWLAAYPIVSDLDRYARGHREHHRLAGTERDPDLPNYASYPVSRASLRRKIVRDLTGQTGWRLARAAWRAGRRRLRLKPSEGNSLAGQALANAVMLALLWAAGHPFLYVLWPVAWLTTYPLVSRLRQAAEHAAVPDLFDADPRMNTRTTYVRWWERLLVAPNSLNYHLEHHLTSAVPCYRLRELHELLSCRGFYAGVPFPRGYGELFRGLIRHQAPQAAAAASAS